MDGSILKEKSSFKMMGLTFSCKLDWGSYIVSIDQTASKKIEVLIRSIKFLSPEVALYLYKSTIWLCMEYCCHGWAGAPRIICKNCETHLLIILVLSSPFPPKSMLKIVVSLGHPETKFYLPSTTLT